MHGRSEALRKQNVVIPPLHDVRFMADVINSARQWALRLYERENPQTPHSYNVRFMAGE